jgi:catechol 2,3-dioxygenase-like lactoylglutathione lyase family enzyme
VPCWIDTDQSDPEAAVAFYGGLFGWEILDLGAGYAWALRVHGDFLDQRRPGMRAGMAEMRAGAVRGRRCERRADRGRHVAALGSDLRRRRRRRDSRRGRSSSEACDRSPFDAAWVRMTVIADPQGATFTASKFVPESKGAPSTR